MPPRPLRRRVTAALVTAALVYALWLGALFVLQRALIYPGQQRAPVAGAELALADLERWTRPLDGGDAEVVAWFVPAEGPAPRGAVVFTHGNGELVDDHVRRYARYRALGLHVLAVEYRGYGRSGGSPSQAALVDDLRVFRERLVADPRVDPSRVVYHGRSLGGGVICGLAATHPPRALVLESSFSSLASFASGYLAPAFLMRDPYDNLSVVSHLDLPILIIHGRQDRVIPFAHAERLAEAATEPPTWWVCDDCGHNDLPRDVGAYWAALAAWLDRVGVSGPAG